MAVKPGIQLALASGLTQPQSAAMKYIEELIANGGEITIGALWGDLGFRADRSGS